MTPRLKTLLGAALLAAVACAVHAPALDVGFFSDDYQWLGRMNATLERPSYVFTVFFRDFNPVLHSSFALDWILGGNSAWLWHADSILLHGLATALLFLLCLRLRAPFPVAVAATLLWALNVRLSETVLWPAARGHQLATVCTLAALVWVLSRPGGSRWPALLFVAVGLFSKETALFALPAIPFFLPRWRRERRFLAGLAGLGAGFVLLNVFIKGDLHTSGAGLGALILKTPFILLRPLGLGELYGFDAVALLVVGVAFLGLAWWLMRASGPAGLAGLIWVLACSAPIVPLDKLSSRYLYLPSVGYAVLFCTICTTIRPLLRSETSRRFVPPAAGAGIALVLLTNALGIEREIGDYRLLARPYAELVERFAPALSTLEPGQTLLVVDAAPQTTIPDLAGEILERGNITKLIPYRRHAIDGLIELPDILNVALPRRHGTLGRPLAAAEDGETRWFRYDGNSLVEVRPRPLDSVPAQRIHRAAWDEADRYFAKPR